MVFHYALESVRTFLGKVLDCRAYRGVYSGTPQIERCGWIDFACEVRGVVEEEKEKEETETENHDADVT